MDKHRLDELEDQLNIAETSRTNEQRFLVVSEVLRKKFIELEERVDMKLGSFDRQLWDERKCRIQLFNRVDKLEKKTDVASSQTEPEVEPGRWHRMSKPRRCDSCFHSIRCQWLLGDSYNPAGPCDWDPSRWNRRRAMKDFYYVDEGGILSYPDGRPMSPADAAAKINKLVQDNTRYRDRLQIDPGGSDKIDELRQATQFLRHEIESLKDQLSPNANTKT